MVWNSSRQSVGSGCQQLQMPIVDAFVFQALVHSMCFDKSTLCLLTSSGLRDPDFANSLPFYQPN